MPGGFHPPPSVIASWPTPNYVDPETKGKGLFAISLILCIAAILAVGARLLVFSVGQTAVFSYTENRHQYYRHIWDVPPQDYSFRQMNSWIMQLLFAISTSCTKASILLLYKRVIQGTVNRKFMIVVKLAIAVNFAYFIVFFFLMIFQCRPVSSFWEQFSYPTPYEEDFSCLFEGAVPMANAIVSVVTDFLAALLPICLFGQIQLPVRQKISLAIVFGIGFVVCILGIVRTVVLHHTFYNTYDVSYVCYYIWTCTVTENHLGVICAAVPPLRALASRFLGRAWNTASKRSGASNTDPGTGYALRSGISANRDRDSKAIGETDIYPIDSDSEDRGNGLVKSAASITTNSLPRGRSEEGRGGSSDIDGIYDLETGVEGDTRVKRSGR
ncbi:hypothetical protein FQN54_000598 [Arachnomyces sp. PD_36]|nr:hypothetical protein FQN54_000598 [Arachnomyces sp. PD_36]